ncbi:MAG: NnrS family protein, partial [Gammaproteobacteria bacterium]
RIGLYSGIYLIIALIFVMGRRVMPFFIEKGVDYPVQLKNRQWLDVSSLVLFLAFWIADLVRPDTLPVALLALALLVLHAIRLVGWYTPGIWKKPLLWVLYVGYGWLVTGFALKAAVVFIGISPFLPLHAFAYGGIGMITLGMMARVTLGHTGRNVFDPPPVLLFWMFALLLCGAVIRVLLPLLDPAHYMAWIGLSQGLWIIAFTLFLTIFLPMLIRPRRPVWIAGFCLLMPVAPPLLLDPNQ